MVKMFLLPILLFVATAPINATLPDVNSFIPSMPSMPTLLQMVPFNGQIIIDDQVFTFGDPNAPRPPTPAVLPETPNQLSQEAPQSPQAPASPQEQTIGSPQAIDQSLPSPMEAPQALNPSPTNFASRIPDFGPLPSGNPTVPSLASPVAPSLASAPPSAPMTSSSLPNIGSTEVGSTFAQNTAGNFNDEFSQVPSSTPVPFGLPRRSNDQMTPTQQPQAPANRNQAESPLVVMPMVVSPDRLLQSENAENSPTTTPLPGLATGSTLPIPALFASMNGNERTASESRRAQPITLSPIPSVLENKKAEQPLEKASEELNDSTEEEKLNRESPFLIPLTDSQKSNDSVLNMPSVRAALQLPPLQTNLDQRAVQTPRVVESVIPFAFEPTLFSSNPKIPTLAELDAQMERNRRQMIN